MLDPLAPPAPLDLGAVLDAARRIEGRVVRTPLLRRRLQGDCELLLKPEALQPTGAFKLRGALNLMLSLPPDCPGVVAHSSGNHAQAVARAAAELGLAAVVVMPSDAPPRKRAATEAWGAEVVVVSPDSAERERVAAEIARTRGFAPVVPFDDARIIAGQATCALELLEDAGAALDRFYAPLSGGGLMAGCALVVRERAPGAEIVGVEPATGNRWQRSLAAGARETVAPPVTLADGLRVRTPGALTWSILRGRMDRVETVTDDELLGAMAWAVRELRVVLEPSGAAALAVALREGRGRCGVILSGGNVEREVLAAALARGG